MGAKLKVPVVQEMVASKAVRSHFSIFTFSGAKGLSVRDGRALMRAQFIDFQVLMQALLEIERRSYKQIVIISMFSQKDYHKQQIQSAYQNINKSSKDSESLS